MVEMVVMPKMAFQRLLWSHFLADCPAVLEGYYPTCVPDYEHQFNLLKDILQQLTLQVVGDQRQSQVSATEQAAAATWLSESLLY